jgi:two-component system response regulator YesN
MNRTVAAEIAHCRIGFAKQLLLESDLKAHDIAERSGFTNMCHFSEAFLRMEGVRPSEFRQRHAGQNIKIPGI